MKTTLATELNRKDQHHSNPNVPTPKTCSRLTPTTALRLTANFFSLNIMDVEKDELIPMEDSTISAILQDIDKKLPKVPKKKLSHEEIANKAHLNVPDQFKQRYIDILFKHQQAISVNKYDLGLAKSFQHQIHLKDNSPSLKNKAKDCESYRITES